MPSSPTRRSPRKETFEETPETVLKASLQSPSKQTTPNPFGSPKPSALERVISWLTWWIPKSNGWFHRHRTAFALVVLITGLIGAILLLAGVFVYYSGYMTLSALKSFNDPNENCYVAVAGNIVDFTERKKYHLIRDAKLDESCGQDVTDEFFPRTSELCGLRPDPIELKVNYTHPHNFASLSPIFSRRNKREWKAYVQLTDAEIKRPGQHWVIIDGAVYNMTHYVRKNLQYLPSRISRVILQYPNQDITTELRTFGTGQWLEKTRQCLDAVHFIGLTTWASSSAAPGSPPTDHQTWTALIAVGGSLIGAVLIFTVFTFIVLKHKNRTMS